VQAQFSTSEVIGSQRKRLTLLVVENRDFLQINLARLMGEKRLSQRKLAEAAKVSEHTIFRAVSKGVRPRGDNLYKIADALGVTEADLLSPPPGTRPVVAEPSVTYKADTVGEMSPAELEALVSRASKRDSTINMEIARLKKEIASIPPVIFEKWAGADREIQALGLYFLTGDDQYSDRLSIKSKDQLNALVRILGMKPSKD
jgi:transcriptional regulator with XRE-family HTH domain